MKTARTRMPGVAPRLTVRLGSAEQAALLEMTQDWKRPAAEVIRQLIRNAAGLPAPVEPVESPPLPEPPDEAELLRLLGVKARQGSLTATKLLLDEQRRQPGAPELGKPSIFAKLEEVRAKNRREGRHLPPIRDTNGPGGVG